MDRERGDTDTAWLVKCSSQPGLVKLWRDEGGLVKLMFEKAADQAHIFIVGLQDCVITLQEAALILIEEVSHEDWVEQFYSPCHSSPMPFGEFSARFIRTHARDGDGQGHSSSEDRHTPQARDIGAEGRADSVTATGGGGSDASTSGGVPADDVQPQVDMAHPISDDRGVKKVEVQLRIKGKPGEGISPYLYLMCDKRFCTAIESLVVLEFSQRYNEDEKLLDVTLGTTFTLPLVVVVSELRPASSDSRVGVLHDGLVCSYYAEEPQSLPLVKHHAIDLSMFDVSTKATSSSAKGYTIGAAGGLPTKMATAKVTGAFHQSFAKGKETSTSLKLDAIQGTMFVVGPYYAPELTQEALAYTALHQVPLKNTSYEESGLHVATRRKDPLMSMGKPVSMECSGHFWVMSDTTETHVFEASRDLGEFSLMEGNKKCAPKLLIGKQVLRRKLLVNHGFRWEHFDGRLFRRILSSVQGQGDPIEGLMGFV